MTFKNYIGEAKASSKTAPKTKEEVEAILKNAKSSSFGGDFKKTNKGFEISISNYTSFFDINNWECETGTYYEYWTMPEYLVITIELKKKWKIDTSAFLDEYLIEIFANSFWGQPDTTYNQFIKYYTKQMKEEVKYYEEYLNNLAEL